MTLLTDIRKVAQLGNDGKLLPSQAPDYPVDSVNGQTGNVVLSVAEIFGAAPIASPVFTGNPRSETTLLSSNDTSIATTAFVKGQGYATTMDLSNYAPLASPALTGNPTAPTPSLSDNDTSIATTSFVRSAIDTYSVTFGQSLNNVTSSRISGNTYTNSSNSFLVVYIVANSSSPATYVKGYINGIQVQSTFIILGNEVSINLIVPPGATYRITAETIVSWHELV